MLLKHHSFILFALTEKMKLVSEDEQSNVLDEIVIVKFELLPQLLQIIQEKPRISQNELKKKSKYSGGKIYLTVRAMKTMNFVQNGNGLTITDFGKSYLQAYTIMGNKLPKEIIKRACLSVPLFNKIYEGHPEEKDPQNLFILFFESIISKYPQIDVKLIGSAVRRYLSGIHNIKVRVGAKINPNPITKNTPTKLNNNSKILDTLKGLKLQLNLTDNEFQIVISALPPEKRDEILSQLLKVI